MLENFVFYRIVARQDNRDSFKNAQFSIPLNGEFNIGFMAFGVDKQSRLTASEATFALVIFGQIEGITIVDVDVGALYLEKSQSGLCFVQFIQGADKIDAFLVVELEQRGQMRENAAITNECACTQDTT